MENSEAKSILDPLGNSETNMTGPVPFGPGKVVVSATDETVTAVPTAGNTWHISRKQVAVITVTTDATVGTVLYTVPLDITMNAGLQTMAKDFTHFRYDSFELSANNTAAIASASGGIRFLIQHDPARPIEGYQTTEDKLELGAALVGSKIINTRTSGGISYQSEPGDWRYTYASQDVRFSKFGNVSIIVASQATDGEARWILQLSASVQFKGLNKEPTGTTVMVKTPAYTVNPDYVDLLKASGEWYIFVPLDPDHFPEGRLYTPANFWLDALIKDSTTEESMRLYRTGHSFKVEGVTIDSQSARGILFFFDADHQNINNPVIDAVYMSPFGPGYITTTVPAAHGEVALHPVVDYKQPLHVGGACRYTSNSLRKGKSLKDYHLEKQKRLKAVMDATHQLNHLGV